MYSILCSTDVHEYLLCLFCFLFFVFCFLFFVLFVELTIYASVFIKFDAWVEVVVVAEGSRGLECKAQLRRYSYAQRIVHITT